MNHYTSLILAFISPLSLVAGGKPAQDSEQKAPKQYVWHAAVSRSQENVESGLSSCLRAMAMGNKRVSWSMETELESIPEGKELIQKHNLKILFGELSKWDNYVQHGKETLWKKIRLAYARWIDPRDLLPNRHIIIYKDGSRDRALAFKEYTERKSFEGPQNDYIMGKLLDYPEEDIEYFYEANKEEMYYVFKKDFRTVLQEHRKEAQEFFAARNLEF